MSRLQKRGKQEKPLVSDGAQKVIVAVKASREIPKTALIWALTHVVQPGDCITLIVVVPSHNSGRKLWGFTRSFPMFAGDCASGHRKSHSEALPEIKSDLTDTCSQMILQLHDVYDPNKINVKIKIVSGSPCGAVAAESKKAQANWVVLDKHLKQEEKRCMDELQCNIVVMKRSQAKVLRLNLVGSPKKDADKETPLPTGPEAASEKHAKNSKGLPVTPTSSPELGTPFTSTEAGTSSVSSSDPGTSPFFTLGMNGYMKKDGALVIKENDLDDSGSETESESQSLASTSMRFQPWISEYITNHRQSSQEAEESLWKNDDRAQISTTKALLEKFSKLDVEAGLSSSRRIDMEFSGSLRDAISLSRSAPPGPPPLCSICQHKAPVFGKPPRLFSYAELELATGGFSQANFLAEGGYGSVHRGVLPEGQVVAVKQHKLASSQGDVEFCSEVEVLSCAQHRNVVMLIGFCIEDSRRLLVYEYICNGSLDSHLYGRQKETLEWSARQKIAVGAARGLRYLHEECRVGCIVHRDMRPNNILITHDNEPLVGDFGLARWQPDGELGVDTRVIGTFGYLAPEYAQSGQITEKADVYSFGVVLVELVTGRKAIDITRPKGQQCLTEWARPLLEEYAVDELIDPRLGNHFVESEVICMLHAASLCIRRDPHLRPRMSQVLRILEGDMIMDGNYASTPGSEAGNRSGRFWADHYSGHLTNDGSDRFSERLSVESPRLALRERERSQRFELNHNNKQY
ncbi:PREDICTED: inactive protein kinase SELMODRAFT_444075-like [Camelina sativa]|uniref:Inactive protein kinase SELMODRAFT_444075-like n=1 Tax=Camelina sativa TaxID=90675 RepID=A0ABM0W3M5_CAMSA|nr:PREDICTED: inactive protein kinase SELMODRAFT_444075-like [Camelina sativa]XP_010465222.1 PREDICTED: inactive protein kinase SELMODRAFT_444075-like [Camelina sativa]XP_010465223.1 PREDICTED: inactive protein kinase SELMODRAFT_444075-like [Camelina sativa]XP_010465224.1 PREDICTED: inactive protein kinase SELMODRAFT_444075-like [Camelina sativa]XP_010465225.1 PREDICTED: inactive protein kinase SELMODRAFT_444075-like [Camelina sativa]